METKTISFRVSHGFDRGLRIAAAMQNMDRSAFIRQALSEKLVEIQQPASLPAINAENDGSSGLQASLREIIMNAVFELQEIQIDGMTFRVFLISPETELPPSHLLDLVRKDGRPKLESEANFECK